MSGQHIQNFDMVLLFDIQDTLVGLDFTCRLQQQGLARHCEITDEGFLVEARDKEELHKIKELAKTRRVEERPRVVRRRRAVAASAEPA